MSQRFTRRDLFRTTGAALGAPLAHPAAAAAPPEVVRHRGYQEAPGLRLAIPAFAHDALLSVLKETEWEARVELVSSPSSSTELFALTSAGGGPPDVMSIPDDVSPRLYREGRLEPLDGAIPEETWNDFSEILWPQFASAAWHSHEGTRFRVPHEFSMSFTFYRQDLGVPPPKTWDDVASIGKEFTRPPMFGTLEALSDPGTIYIYLAYLAVQAGGNIFAFDDATLHAFGFAYDLLYTYGVMPEAAFSTDYFRQNQEYLTGNVALMRQWSFFWEVADGTATAALPPIASDGGPKTWWGGSGFSVPSGAHQKDEALRLLAFITSPAIAPRLAEQNSVFLVPRQSVFDEVNSNPDRFSGATRQHILAMQEYVGQGVPVPRPFDDRFVNNLAQAERLIGQVAQSYLTNQLALSDVPAVGNDLLGELAEQSQN